MNLKTYIDGAIKTESRIEQATVSDRPSFEQVLRAVIASGTLLDLYKKNIYYGKEIPTQKWDHALSELSIASKNLTRDAYLPFYSPSTLDIDPRVLHATIGIATEGTELIEAVYKVLTEHKTVDKVNLAEEVGDVSWYIAILIDALGANWDDVLTTNLKKLEARNKGKKFNAEATINRDVEAERKILEGKISTPDKVIKTKSNSPGYAGDVGDINFGGTDF